MKRADSTLGELMARTILPETRRDPHLTLMEVLFHVNFLSFDDKGLSPAYKDWASLPRNTPLPLVRWRNPISLQWEPPDPLLSHGRWYACVSSQTSMMPIWVLVRGVCLAMDQPASTKDGSDVYTPLSSSHCPSNKLTY